MSLALFSSKIIYPDKRISLTRWIAPAAFKTSRPMGGPLMKGGSVSVMPVLSALHLDQIVAEGLER